MKYAITENGRLARLDEVKFSNVGATNCMLVKWPSASEHTIFTTIGKQSISIDNGLGNLLGLYIGDGWCDKNVKHPLIHIANIDHAIISRYRDLVNKYFRDVNAKGYTAGNTCHDYWDNYDSVHGKFSINIPSSIRDSLIGLFGHGAYNKHIPQEFINTPTEFRWGMLSGLMDTDGSISCRDVVKKGKLQQNKNVMYATQSWQLAQDVQLLCMSLGIGASITITDRNGRYEFTVVMSSIDTYKRRSSFSCVSSKISILDTFTFGDQVNPKDILPFDKDIKSSLNARYSDNPSMGVIVNNAVKNGFIVRETFNKYANDDAMCLMRSKYGTDGRWERVLGILSIDDDVHEHELIARIKEIKDNVKKVA